MMIYSVTTLIMLTLSIMMLIIIIIMTKLSKMKPNKMAMWSSKLSKTTISKMTISDTQHNGTLDSDTGVTFKNATADNYNNIQHKRHAAFVSLC